MHDVFISYSTVDRAIAEEACARLEASGARCWIAPRDVTPGKLWSAEIVEAIAASRMFVLVLSATSNASSDVTHEIEIAARHHVRIIPFRVHSVPLSKSIEYFVSDTHWLDATEPPLEPHLDKLADVVRTGLAIPPGAEWPAGEVAARIPPPVPPRAVRQSALRNALIAARPHGKLLATALVSAVIVLSITLVERIPWLGGVSALTSGGQPANVVVTKILGAAIRARPSSDAPILVTVGCGAALEQIPDANAGWYHVRHNGTDGWVGQRRAQPGAQVEQSVCNGAPATPWQMGQTVSGQAPLCPGPDVGETGSDCAPVGQQFALDNGPVEAASGEDWFRVRSTSTGPSGWVRAALLLRR